MPSNSLYASILVRVVKNWKAGENFPTYKELGEEFGCTTEKARDTVQLLLQDGLVSGKAGKKPTAVTPLGERQAEEIDTAPGEVVVAAPKRAMLTETLANKFGIEATKMFQLVANTMISKKESEGAVTPEEVAVVMHIMDKYDLDPLLKQIHAFVSQGKLQVMLGYDGWVKEKNKAVATGDLLGVTVTESKETLTALGSGFTVPEYMEGTAVFSEESGKLPVTFRAYFKEWYVANQQWDTRPYHRIRMKAFCGTVREALGIGLSDEVDRDQFEALEPSYRVMSATETTEQSISEKLAANRLKRGETIPVADVEDVTPVTTEAPEGAPDAPDPEEVTEGAGEPELFTGADREPEDLDLDAALIAEQRRNGELS